MCDGWKTPENPSNLAECDGVTFQNAPNEGVREKRPKKHIPQHRNGVAEPPAQDSPEERVAFVDPDQGEITVDQAIIKYARSYPKKSTNTIAKHFGCQAKRVEELLKGIER